ncbi:MAG: OmpA family protein [Acidimicrobiales bacterium]
MATDETKRHKADEPDRAGTIDRPSGAGIALADEGDVAFGAMAGIAVISAVLVSMLALAGFFGYQKPSSSHEVAAVTEDATHEDADTDADHEAEDDATDEEADSGEEDEAAAAAAEEEEAAAAAAEEAANAGAAAAVTVSQAAVELNGTVPDQATADALVAAAIASGYTEDQITNNLEIAEGASPYTLTVDGSLTSEAAAASLATNLGGTGADLGADFTFDDQIEVTAASDLETELNALVAASPILFNSGTDVITAETAPVVAQVAELLIASDGQQVEVGGHTDSRGGDAGNLALSNDRAARVVAELIALGVDPDQLVAKGYGETQLVENPDDTAEQQQANRRIEFRVLG